MEHDIVLAKIHEAAAEFAAANGRTVAPGQAETVDDNLLRHYGFTSLDALEYLLILEETFGITFEDDELSDEILSSARGLADYVVTATASESA